jgi:hypothetical protein
MASSKKGCLIIIGTFFREGTQNQDKKETATSYETQKKASDSHRRFANAFGMDIHILAYTTKWEETLREWYKGSTILFKPKKYPLINDFLNDSDINTVKLQYDYIFLIRSDMYIKEYLYTVFNPTWERIMMCSICFTMNNYHICRAGPHNQIEPRVNDAMLFIPKPFFHIHRYWFDTHTSWIQYKYTCMLSDKNMGFIIESYHDSDSYKDMNPVYYFVGRCEHGYSICNNTKIPAYYQLHPDKDSNMDERLTYL